MKNAGLFVILIFRRKTFEKSTCFLLAGLYVYYTISHVPAGVYFTPAHLKALLIFPALLEPCAFHYP